MKIKTLTLAFALLASCASSNHQRGSAAGELLALDANESQLIASFNANAHKAQLLVVLSPT